MRRGDGSSPSIRQHTLAYVSIVSIRQHTAAVAYLALRYRATLLRPRQAQTRYLAAPAATRRVILTACVCICTGSIRQHTSAHFSIRQAQTRYLAVPAATSRVIPTAYSIYIRVSICAFVLVKQLH